ncbi:hypothetical protein EMCRGX_G019600 [Ephydatia muelleri]
MLQKSSPLHTLKSVDKEDSSVQLVPTLRGPIHHEVQNNHNLASRLAVCNYFCLTQAMSLCGIQHGSEIYWLYPAMKTMILLSRMNKSAHLIPYLQRVRYEALCCLFWMKQFDTTQVFFKGDVPAWPMEMYCIVPTLSVQIVYFLHHHRKGYNNMWCGVESLWPDIKVKTNITSVSIKSLNLTEVPFLRQEENESDLYMQDFRLCHDYSA